MDEREAALEGSRIFRHRDSDTRYLSRSEHRHIHGRQFCYVAASTGCGIRPHRFLSNQYPGAEVEEIYSVGVPDYLDRKRDFTDVFEQEAMYRSEAATVDVNGTAERTDGMRITPSMFPLLKVGPAMGRAFAEDEARLRKSCITPSHRPYFHPPPKKLRQTWAALPPQVNIKQSVFSRAPRRTMESRRRDVGSRGGWLKTLCFM